MKLKIILLIIIVCALTGCRTITANLERAIQAQAAGHIVVAVYEQPAGTVRTVPLPPQPTREMLKKHFENGARLGVMTAERGLVEVWDAPPTPAEAISSLLEAGSESVTLWFAGGGTLAAALAGLGAGVGKLKKLYCERNEMETSATVLSGAIEKLKRAATDGNLDLTTAKALLREHLAEATPDVQQAIREIYQTTKT